MNRRNFIATGALATAAIGAGVPLRSARGAHHEPRQTVPTERPKNRPYTPGGRVKSPNCKKCVNIRIPALYARYGPQTRAPASWFDRLGAWVAWGKRGKGLVYLPLPGKAKG